MPTNSINVVNLNNFLTAIFAGLTALFTLLLAIFAWFQWKAVKKQNDQNLFKMRMEHYFLFNSLDMDLKILIINKESGSLDSILNKMNILLCENEKILINAKYLFNEEIYNIEKSIIEECKTIIKLFENKDKDELNKHDKNLLANLRKDLEENVGKFLLNL